MIHIVGGAYKEYCAWPEHNTLLGSAGRAALCLSQIDSSLKITLHTKVGEQESKQIEEIFSLLPNCQLDIDHSSPTVSFDYFHPLSTPKVTPPQPESLPQFSPTKDKKEFVILFGMIEANPSITASTIIYDPQNTEKPILFSKLGGAADTLIYIINQHELKQLYISDNDKINNIETMASWLYETEKANTVIVKCGKKGAFVYSDKEAQWVSPYRTDHVFPIGSGDAFVAAFSFYWKIQQLSPVEAAQNASVAVAHYVSKKIMNTPQSLDQFKKSLIPLAENSYRKKIYLAGPFFTLSELWMINEAKHHIESFGMDVFSPYHELGIGTADEVVQEDIKAIKVCDAVYAIFNGTDPGILFEVGYARSINKPVIILAENPKAEELKMYDGSNCKIFSDFASSIYNLSWEAE